MTTMKTFACLFLVFVAHISTSNAHRPTARYKQCEYKELTKCNKVFMNNFRNAAPRLHVNGVYCRGFQVYANCLQSSSCTGRFVDLNRFMILQHMIMDKTLKVCPQHDFTALKELVQADRPKFQKAIGDLIGVDKGGFERCAQKIHRKCTSCMAKDLSSDDRMCFGVKNFLRCYKKPGIACEARIYRQFLKVIKRVAHMLLRMFKKRKGMMPHC